MTKNITIGDKIRLTDEAVAYLLGNPEIELMVEDIFDDGGTTVLALVLPPEETS